jgi:hypothetical protein
MRVVAQEAEQERQSIAAELEQDLGHTASASGRLIVPARFFLVTFGEAVEGLGCARMIVGEGGGIIYGVIGAWSERRSAPY